MHVFMRIVYDNIVKYEQIREVSDRHTQTHSAKNNTTSFRRRV